MWFDVVVAVILLITTIRGAAKGIVWQLAAIAALVLSFVFAQSGSLALSPMIPLEPPLNRWTAMFVIYVGCSLLAFGAARSLREAIEKAKFTAYDSHLGAILGFAKGAVISIVLIFFAVTLSEKLRDTVMRSKSGYAAAVVLDKLEPVLPHGVADIIAPYLRRLDGVGGVELGDGESEPSFDDEGRDGRPPRDPFDDPFARPSDDESMPRRPGSDESYGSRDDRVPPADEFDPFGDGVPRRPRSRATDPRDGGFGDDPRARDPRDERDARNDRRRAEDFFRDGAASRDGLPSRDRTGGEGTSTRPPRDDFGGDPDAFDPKRSPRQGGLDREPAGRDGEPFESPRRRSPTTERSDTEVLGDLASRMAGSLDQEMKDRVLEALKNTQPEDRRELVDKLGRGLPGVIRGIADDWRNGKPAEPRDRSERDTLLKEIAAVYADTPADQAAARSDWERALRGVPERVVMAVLKDWHADAYAVEKDDDPDPNTTVNTPLDVRIVRQLDEAGVARSSLDEALQNRLRNAQRR